MKELKLVAYEYGKLAFVKGNKAIPCLDKDFNENIIKGCKVGEGLPYLKAWIEGWTDARLKAQVGIMEIRTTRQYWEIEVERIISSKSICLSEKKSQLQNMIDIAVEVDNLEVKEICESVLYQLILNGGIVSLVTY